MMSRTTRKKAAPVHPALTSAWQTVIAGLGYDPKNPHLADSPARVARFLEEWHTKDKPPPKLTTFPNRPRVDELVICDGIQFYSVCAHHGVPFFGTAAIGYVPKDKVLGLSKFARVVDHFANRFQTQEHLTQEIATYLNTALTPLGIGVVLQAEHLCMSMRGVRKPGHRTTTSVMLGNCKKDPSTRAELLHLAGARR
jgi:GTP cyclohydrolase I